MDFTSGRSLQRIVGLKEVEAGKGNNNKDTDKESKMHDSGHIHVSKLEGVFQRCGHQRCVDLYDSLKVFRITLLFFTKPNTSSRCGMRIKVVVVHLKELLLNKSGIVFQSLRIICYVFCC